MATITVCNKKSENSVRDRIKKTASIIKEYEWIVDAYVSDFFTKEFWSRLPTSLQEYFDVTQPPGLAWLLHSCGDLKQTFSSSHLTPPPLSLLSLRQCISLLSLPRTAVDTESSATIQTVLSVLSKRTSLVSGSQVTRNSDPEDFQSQNFSCPEGQLLPAVPGPVPNYKNGQNMDMQHIFRKHVKPKKQHEINNLGQMINVISEAAESSSVVDVGAGIGHLARVLAFQHSLHVTTIEATGGHAPRASELDKDLRKNIHKAKLRKRKQTSSAYEKSSVEPREHSDGVKDKESVLTSSSGSAVDSSSIDDKDMSARAISRSGHAMRPNGDADGRTRSWSDRALKPNDDGDGDSRDAELPSHVICTVQPDIAASQFLNIILERPHTDDASSNNTKSHMKDGRFVLVGLHACGDLTPTLLRVFLNCPTARGLASVACCYMKMCASSGRPDSPELDNFPMSSYLQNLQFQTLSYEAREMACHFADAYSQRLKENPPHLKIHCYRAALQLLVTTVDPTFQSGKARLISKKKANMTFTEYASENLKKLNISIDSVPPTLLSHCEDLTKDCWRRVVAFYTLRLSLAPLVETLLLLDRSLFLLENGIPSLLVPVFDPHISPRNFALLALKQD